MSRYIATRAMRGAHDVYGRAEALLKKALEEKGPDTPVAFPNTAYHLPFIFAMTAMEVQTVGDMVPAMDMAKSLLHPMPTDSLWLPYLGETADAGVAQASAAMPNMIRSLRASKPRDDSFFGCAIDVRPARGMFQDPFRTCSPCLPAYLDRGTVATQKFQKCLADGCIRVRHSKCRTTGPTSAATTRGRC